MPAMSECLASSFASVYSQNIPINQEPHQMFSGHVETIALSSDDINAASLSWCAPFVCLLLYFCLPVLRAVRIRNILK